MTARHLLPRSSARPGLGGTLDSAPDAFAPPSGTQASLPLAGVLPVGCVGRAGTPPSKSSGACKPLDAAGTTPGTPCIAAAVPSLFPCPLRDAAATSPPHRPVGDRLGTHDDALEWVTIPPLVTGGQHHGLDLYPAAGWVTLSPPLKC